MKGLQSAKEKYITPNKTDENLNKIVNILEKIDEAMKATDENTLGSLIDEYHLVREHCPSHLLKSPEVWRHLLKEMPAEAMIRNISVMTQRGIFEEGSDELELVYKRFYSRKIVILRRLF